MRKEVVVVFFLVVALAVAGCKGGGTKTPSTASTPFIGGTEGLRITFVENAPPKEILDNKQMKFNVILRLENVGEKDVRANEVKITLGGIYPPDFGKQNSQLQNVVFSTITGKANAVLTGVKKDPEGDKISGAIDEITFQDLEYQKLLQGNNEFPIQADVCYTYQTRAVGDFCMRQDLTKISSGVCEVKGSKPVFGSGSPMQVVSLDESVGGAQKVILKFKIKAGNVGSFFKPDAIGSANDKGCPKGDFVKENFVKVTVDTGVQGGAEGLTCSGLTERISKSKVRGDVRLPNGEASVTCFQDGINVDAVQKVDITLDYNHLISTSTKLLVKHLPGEFATTSSSPPSPPPSGSPPAVPPVPSPPPG